MNENKIDFGLNKVNDVRNSTNFHHKPECFFCHSRRQRNLILVGEDSLNNPEFPDGDGIHSISKAVKYHEDYKKMRRVYWVCRRCFYLNPSACRRYKNILEKKEVVVSRFSEVDG